MEYIHIFGICTTQGDLKTNMKDMDSEAAVHFYDGSFNGFLTVLYDIEQRGLAVEILKKKEKAEDALFPDPSFIETRLKHARILWEQLRIDNYSALKTLYFAFMSKERNLEKPLLDFYYSWRKNRDAKRNIMYDNRFHEIFNLAADVEKEKIQTERKLTGHQDPETPTIRYIKPRHNILPLISKRMRTRFRNSEWYIFDMRRKYGLHHCNGSIAFVPFRPEFLKEENINSVPSGTSKFPFLLHNEESKASAAVA
ncbi:hypothetical protein GCM10011361_03360 [Muriicola marianensis]|uniref:DUF4130 domain-containing protein n=2 Tax=Muriicola marianensis TaxID=1324801 RepID=A0ABQ1QSR8_9FLAO|nr:hypothetical protein GCM10011361_03360 [Muriicola marianensis]